MTQELTLHASCVALGERAVLLAGPSGSGKSSLALALIALGYQLVADDYTILTASNGRLLARSPPRLAGLIEVFGVGLIAKPFRIDVSVVLHVVLTEAAIERLPHPHMIDHLGISLPCLRLPARHCGNPAAVAAYWSSLAINK